MLTLEINADLLSHQFVKKYQVIPGHQTAFKTVRIVGVEKILNSNSNNNTNNLLFERMKHNVNQLLEILPILELHVHSVAFLSSDTQVGFLS